MGEAASGGESLQGARVHGSPEKILLVHNAYMHAGGEDAVFEDEGALLEGHGHLVLRYQTNNDRISGMGPISLASKTVWNRGAYRGLRDLIRRQRPGVVHLHNTFPLISPAAHHAAAAEGVPVVQTLHNYRLLCPNGLFFRDGRPCEDCLGKALALPGVAHGCYRESRAATAATAGMVAAHRLLGTWSGGVDRFVALTAFARDKFIEGGLPAERISVKPNFVSPDPGVGDGRGGYALFVGRLSQEKGVGTLLKAWDQPGGDTVPLKIVGDGPFSGAVARAAEQNPLIEWVGRRSPGETRRLMQDAAMTVLPSEVYETFGRVAAESFAAGTPVVAAKIGAIEELVDHGRTGLHFKPGDAGDLAHQVQRLAADTSGEVARMRRAARSEYEEKYTAERNYRLLADIYAAAVGRAA